MLKALADGETDPAALADQRLRATPAQLRDAPGCLHRAQPGLPPTREDGTCRLAIDRAADRPTGPGETGGVCDDERHSDPRGHDSAELLSDGPKDFL